MNKTGKIFISAAFTAFMCTALSGCSDTQIDLNNYIVTEFSGYDTYGKVTVGLDTMTIIEDNLQAFGLEEDALEEEKLAVFAQLKNAINGNFDKSKELSNGEIINFEWTSVKTEKLEEKYPVSFKYSDIEYTVEGLAEIELVDPFESIEVIFEGKSPNGTAKVTSDTSQFSFKLDKNTGLSNGDIVTVTASYGGLPEGNYISSYGKKLSVTEMSYTVEGLASYPQAIAEISSDMQDKMIRQAEDSIKAHCSGWKEGNSLAALESAGCYYLSLKPGFNKSPANRIYYVFKVTANMTGLLEEAYANGDDSIHTGTDEYYTFVYFDEIVNLPDGTTSVDLGNGRICENSVNSNYGYYNFFGTSHYTFAGYKDLDSMFNDCVTAYIESYNYENTVN